eukprot:10066622-Alexandrium_andersonii.AAC.1
MARTRSADSLQGLLRLSGGGGGEKNTTGKNSHPAHACSLVNTSRGPEIVVAGTSERAPDKKSVTPLRPGP